MYVCMWVWVGVHSILRILIGALFTIGDRYSGRKSNERLLEIQERE